MSVSPLDRLVAHGIAGLTADDFAQLVRDLRERNVTSGDARYGVLSEVIVAVDEWLERHDGAGGVPAAAYEEVDTALRIGVLEVLAAPTAAEGARLANTHGERLSLLLGGPRSWQSRGFAQPPSGD